MKKIMALGMMAITITANLAPMTVNAAGACSYNQCYGSNNAVVISGSCSSLDDVKAKLQEAGINGSCADLTKVLGQQNCGVDAAQSNCNSNSSCITNDCTQSSACSNNVLSDYIQSEDTSQSCNQTANTSADDVQEIDTKDQTVEEVIAEDSSKDTTTVTTPEETKDTTTTDQTTTSNSSYAQQVVDLVNVERAKEGLAALTIDTNVEKAAMVRANEIQTKFEHVRPDGSGFVTALKEQNVTYKGAGENIAWGQKTPEEVVTAWMNSPGHRANIMNKNYVHIGVGNLQNSSGTQYWVQLFTY
ncbi:CAP domain-containing protein [Lachnotalea glycerini]|jgi:uncharacterized protein YkwD|nr:CAP domain-containing protein [Lachnotalea glycerini]